MKKILVLFTVLAFLVGFSPLVKASSTVDVNKVNKIVDKANEKINQEINQAVKKADKLSVNLSKDKYDKELDKIVNDLLTKTNRIAEKAIEDSRKLGAVVVCEYVTVVVGNRVVIVDPIRVHSW